MNDETKDELMKRTREWLQSCVNAATRSGVPEEADLEAFILAHIDTEPERQAAAVAAGREEQRESDYEAVPSGDWGTADYRMGVDDARRDIRATPLTATPLADRIAELEARAGEWADAQRVFLTAESERDDLKARLEELTGPVCTDAECPDHDGEHPYHFNAVALFWGRVEDTYENRNALCESAPVPAVQAWREDLEHERKTNARLLTERDAALARVKELEAEPHVVSTVRITTSATSVTEPAQEVEERIAALSKHYGVPASSRQLLDLLQAMQDTEDASFEAARRYLLERDAALERVKEAEDLAEKRLKEVAAWAEKAADWFASPEGAARLDGYRSLAAKCAALEAERDELRQRIIDSCPSPDEGGRIHAGGRIVCGQCHDSEVSHLRAQLAEAVGVLRELSSAVFERGDESNRVFVARHAAQAFLAKHPEGT